MQEKAQFVKWGEKKVHKGNGYVRIMLQSYARFKLGNYVKND